MANHDERDVLAEIRRRVDARSQAETGDPKGPEATGRGKRTKHPSKRLLEQDGPDDQPRTRKKKNKGTKVPPVTNTTVPLGVLATPDSGLSVSSQHVAGSHVAVPVHSTNMQSNNTTPGPTMSHIDWAEIRARGAISSPIVNTTTTTNSAISWSPTSSPLLPTGRAFTGLDLHNQASTSPVTTSHFAPTFGARPGGQTTSTNTAAPQPSVLSNQAQAQDTVGADSDNDNDSEDGKVNNNNLAVSSSANKGKKGKLTLEDLDGIHRAVTETGIIEYRVWISCEEAYPDNDIANKKATDILMKTCVESKVTPKDKNVFAMMVKLMTARASELRGKLKDCVRPLIVSAYGLSTKTSTKAVKANRAKWEMLTKSRSYVFRDPSKRIGAYDNDILQEIIDIFWFESPADVGIQFSTYFNPITKVTIALVFTAVEFCLNEWRTGAKATKKHEKKRGQAAGPTFNAVEWEPIYRHHLKNLRNLEKRSEDNADALRTMCERLYLRGRRAAGASADSEETTTLDDVEMDNFAADMRRDDDSDDEAGDRTNRIDDIDEEGGCHSTAVQLWGGEEDEREDQEKEKDGDDDDSSDNSGDSDNDGVS